MAFEGLERKKAAEKAGLKDDSLYVALRRPEVKALLNEFVADLRKSAAARSIARVDRLADESGSDHVRLEANKFLLGIEGVRPVERHQHDHTVKVVPGYVLDMSGPDLQRPESLRDVGHIIDGDVREVPEGKALPQAVQHAAAEDDARPQDVGGTGGVDDPS